MNTLIILAVVFIIFIYVIKTYNSLIRKRNNADEAFSGIDVQLKKRSDLVPNLVSTIKAYATHEKEIFEEVTRLRAETLNSEKQSDLSHRAKTEGMLGSALSRLMMVAENYPDLKANENFLDLQKQLMGIEEDLQLARRYFNATVRELNIKIESFPSNLIANICNFSKKDFFTIDDETERQVPKISF